MESVSGGERMLAAWCNDCEALHETFACIWFIAIVCPRVGAWTMSQDAWLRVHIDNDPGDEQS